MNILGVSAHYHDAAAALVCDGVVVAAAEEERFTRVKHDARLPVSAITYCLGRLDEVSDVDAVVFYEKPFTTISRIMSTAVQVAPRGFPGLARAALPWLSRKLWVGYELEQVLRGAGRRTPVDMRYVEHHQSHAASAFYPSPFESAAVLTVDGVGEYATASIGHGVHHRLELLNQMVFPHSLGLFYSAMTSYCGFAVNDGEAKLMGLAPYGEPVYATTIREHLIDLRDDGSFSLDQSYFAYRFGTRMTTPKLHRLLGGPPATRTGARDQRHADLAASVQVVLEEVLLRMAARAAELTGERDLCLAGGVALNCVANGRLLRDSPFERVWVQPAAGDAGAAIGAALHHWHNTTRHHRRPSASGDGMSGSLLGPAPAENAAAWADGHGYDYEHLNPSDRAVVIAGLLADGKVVGVADGPMEFGPRALGSRSILADPRDPHVRSRLNERVKRREGFRPFAPAVLAERAQDWFVLDGESPYMLMTATVADTHLRPCDEEPSAIDDRTGVVRSDIPAVTHVDGSARVQTVDRERFPRFWEVLTAFEGLTGCPVLLNTSFNLRDEPIVCTADDAYSCFRRSGIDALVVDDLLFRAGP